MNSEELSRTDPRKPISVELHLRDEADGRLIVFSGDLLLVDNDVLYVVAGSFRLPIEKPNDTTSAI